MMFITVGLMKKDLRKSYWYILFSQSVTNGLFCFAAAFLQTIAIGADVYAKHWFCQATGLWFMSSNMGSVTSQSVLAISRYSAIYFHLTHEKNFRRNATVTVLVLLNIFVFFYSLSFLLLDDFGRVNNGICVFDSMVPWHTYIVVALVVINLIISVFCCVRIVVHLKKQARTMITNEFRQQAKESKNLVKLVLMQVILPFALQAPGAMMSYAPKGVIPPIAGAVVTALYQSHAFLDAILVILLIKPYQTALKEIIAKKLNINVQVTTTVISISVTNNTKY